MIYNLDYHINVGNYTLKMIESVKIKRSVELLSDTAIITLPSMIAGKAINATDSTLTYLEKTIKAGDKVIISLGYNNTLNKEFEGYIEHIENDDNAIKLHCEDEIYRFRKSLPDKQFTKVSIKNLLSWVIGQIDDRIKLNCDYDFTYDSFVVKGATGYDILKKVQEEAKPNVYMKDGTLHIHPQYSEIFGEATYDIMQNIESSKLKYKQADQRKLLVEVEGKSADGKVIKVESGTPGGERMTIKTSGISDKKSLQYIADETLKAHVYTGYEGSFTGWLVPFCDAGYKVTIVDKDYEFKNGSYYVLGVEVNFSASGGERIITIGKKID